MGGDLTLRIQAHDEISAPLATMHEAVSALATAVTQLSERAGGVGGGMKDLADATKHAGTEAETAGHKVAESTGLWSEMGRQIGDVAKLALGFDISRITFSIADHIEHVLGSFNELGEATHKLQTEIGGTAEQVSGDLAVFERWGITNEQAAVSLGILSKNVALYSDESTKAQAKSTGLSGAVDSLGIMFRSASGQVLPMNDILFQIADRFSQMPDGVVKTADAMALFGRSGRDMIPMLNQGSEGLRVAMETAKQYGLVLSQENVEAVYKFGQAQRDLSEVMKGFAVQVGSLVLPVLQSLVEGVTRAAQTFNTTILPVIRTVVDFISTNFGPPIAAALDLVGQGFNSLSGVVGGALNSVLSIVASVGQAIADALSWLNPFAEHSPSLVSQVQDGMGAIQGSYDGITAIALPLQTAGESVKQFGKDSALALKSMASDIKDQLASVTDALKDATTQLSTWGKTPIEGTKAFQDRLDAIDTQTAEVQLKLTNLKLGNDITPQVQALNEQLKQLQLHAPQSPLGGNKDQMKAYQQASRDHQNAVRGLQDQLNGLKTGGAADQIQALQDQLAQLSLQSQQVKLEEKLQLDPFKKQLKEVLNPTLAEKPFAAIIAGAQAAQTAISTLTPQKTGLEDKLKIVQQQLSDQQAANAALASATAKGKAAGGATNPLATTFKDVNKNLEEGKKQLAEWTKKVDEAHTSITHFADKITGPVIAAFNTLKGYLSDANTFDLMGNLFGPNIGPAIDNIVRSLKGLATNVGGIIGDIGQAIKGKGLNLADLWKNLSSGAVDLGGLAVNLGVALFAALKEAVSKIPWDKVWAEAQNVGRFVVSALGDISGDIATWLKAQFLTSIASVWGFLSNAGKNIVAALGDIKGDIATWFKDQFPKNLSDLFQHQEGTGRDAVIKGLLPTPAMLLQGLKDLVGGIDWKGLWSGQTGKGREGQTTGILPSATALTASLVTTFGAIDWKTVWASATKMGAGLVASGLSIDADLTKFFADQFKNINWGPAWTTGTAMMKDFRTAAEPISGILAALAAVVGPLTALLLANAVQASAVALADTAMSIAAGIAETALIGLSAVMAVSPAGALAIALIAVTSELVTLYETNNTARDNIDKAWKGITDSIRSAVDSITTIFRSFVDSINNVGNALSHILDLRDKVARPLSVDLNPAPKGNPAPQGTPDISGGISGGIYGTGKMPSDISGTTKGANITTNNNVTVNLSSPSTDTKEQVHQSVLAALKANGAQ